MEIVKHLQKLVVVLSVVIVMFALTLPAESEKAPSAEQQTGEGISLQPPAFVKSAHAAALAQTDMGFLIEEAGVTAYTKLSQQLDFTTLQSRFKTIRQQTDQFIIGIVIAPGYERLPEFAESAEVQVFLHRDGWIIAYLTRYQTTSALFDWVNYEEKRLTGTMIENVVRLLALDSGVANFNVAYYDFRNPEATNLMLAATREPINQGNSFQVNIPRGLTVYESSWSHAKFTSTYYAGVCNLDDEELSNINPVGEWVLAKGIIAPTKLSLDTNHTLTVVAGGVNPSTGYCGIAIVYKETAQ